MDLSRAVYSRELKIAAMRALDAGSATGEIARKHQLGLKLLERWRGEWRVKGNRPFPAWAGAAPICRRLTMSGGSPSWKHKIGQLTMENDLLKKALQHFRDHPPPTVSGADVCLKKSSKPRRKAKP